MLDLGNGQCAHRVRRKILHIRTGGGEMDGGAAHALQLRGGRRRSRASRPTRLGGLAVSRSSVDHPWREPVDDARLVLDLTQRGTKVNNRGPATRGPTQALAAATHLTSVQAVAALPIERTNGL